MDSPRAESATRPAASQYGERMWKRRRDAVRAAKSGAVPEVAQAPAGWRTGRPPHERVSGTDAAGEPGQDEPGWVEGWFHERLLDGAFDDRGGPDDGPGDHETSS
jgi:hypothetical protein